MMYITGTLKASKKKGQPPDSKKKKDSITLSLQSEAMRAKEELSIQLYAVLCYHFGLHRIARFRVLFNAFLFSTLFYDLPRRYVVLQNDNIKI
jgi:hypothetical protein